MIVSSFFRVYPTRWGNERKDWCLCELAHLYPLVCSLELLSYRPNSNLDWLSWWDYSLWMNHLFSPASSLDHGSLKWSFLCFQAWGERRSHWGLSIDNIGNILHTSIFGVRCEIRDWEYCCLKSNHTISFMKLAQLTFAKGFIILSLLMEQCIEYFCWQYRYNSSWQLDYSCFQSSQRLNSLLSAQLFVTLLSSRTYQ